MDGGDDNNDDDDNDDDDDDDVDGNNMDATKGSRIALFSCFFSFQLLMLQQI